MLLTMGQYLSIPGFLLGVYGVQWSLRKRLPAGWPPDKDNDLNEANDLDDVDDLDDGDDLGHEDEDEAEDERRSGRRAKTKPKAVDVDVDEEFEPRRPKRAAQGDDDSPPLAHEQASAQRRARRYA